MNSQIPLTRDVVLIGGGHTHALVLRQWGMNPLPGARITVINPGPTAPYSGMLPGFVAGHYSRDELDIDLVRLARFAGARVIIGKATGIDREAKLIHVTEREPIAYDIASVDVGIHSAMPEITGFIEHGVPVKPLEILSHRWPHYLDQVQDNASLAVIGGGVAGVEITLAMMHALQSRGVTATMSLIDAGEILGGVAPRAKAKLLQRLADYGVTLRPDSKVAEVTANSIRLESGESITSEFSLGAAGARPHAWLSELGLDLHEGYIVVDEMLRSSDPTIFAAGDCAHLPDNPRPKAGVFAVRAAPVLWHNLRAALSGNKLILFRPQSDYLKLISLGSKMALAEKFGITLSGAALWRWKNQIDQTFMAKFYEYPSMNVEKLPKELASGVTDVLADGKPMCGGCGAKVGRDVLSQVLKTLPQAGRDDVLSQPGDDAAIMRYGEQYQVITTDHLRAFTEDVALQARIAAVHAMGDIWAMGAQAQTVLSTIILPRMSADMQARYLSDIMTAASEVFGAQGAEIVGGHTSLGSELTIGFTITGISEREPIQLSGGQAGDVLILTKPIGTGTLLAAEMTMKARGEDTIAALNGMKQDQAEAATILQDAHAMTDVTGFGLAGHLLGICEASGCGAELDLAAIPVLAGAEKLAEQGVHSTLYPDNFKVAAYMDMTEPKSGRETLLFDPQTAGGLLAAVSADAANEKLAALQEAGYQASRVGVLLEGESLISLIDM
ncbi:selenide, water dikinase SelD [Leucothrix pacifica]|uniref:Selenide, water dikinase SelD n=1 Tax=Leucothrix pacifica TaxID=1247513 RepID=A0A317CA49_9GAMM|nr:selenide, water dikinase SelD [Leucothrix pacifica]PWQ92942.1 selenide, water dikinase SelD [Leucothrix pacifica]